MVAALSVLALDAGVSFLQMRLNIGSQTGLAPLLSYLFYLYGPFVLSGLCGVLFAPFVALPFRDVVSAKGLGLAVANAIAALVTLIGAVTADYFVLASCVILRDVILTAR